MQIAKKYIQEYMQNFFLFEYTGASVVSDITAISVSYFDKERILSAGWRLEVQTLRYWTIKVSTFKTHKRLARLNISFAVLLWTKYTL